MSNLSPKVFVIQKAKPRASDGWMPNLEPANKFGAIHFIFDADDRPHLDPSTCLKKAAVALSSFNPETDYLCWSMAGDPASMWLVIMILAGTGANSLQFLYWSRGKSEEGRLTNENGFYFPITLSISKLKGLE